MKNIIITNKQLNILQEEYGNKLYQYQNDIDNVCNDILHQIQNGNNSFITRIEGNIEKTIADWKIAVKTEINDKLTHISGEINFDTWSPKATIILHIQYTNESLQNGELLRKIKTAIFHELTHSSDKRQAINGWNNNDDVELSDYDYDYENNASLINGKLSKPIQDVLYILFNFSELNAFSTEIYQDALNNIPFNQTDTYNEIYLPLKQSLNYIENKIKNDELKTLQNFFATKRYQRTYSSDYFDKKSLYGFYKWFVREVNERLDKFSYKMQRAYHKGKIDNQKNM